MGKVRVKDNRLDRYTAREIARAVETETGEEVSWAAVRQWRRRGLPRWGAAKIQVALDTLDREVADGV